MIPSLRDLNRKLSDTPDSLTLDWLATVSLMLLLRRENKGASKMSTLTALDTSIVLYNEFLLMLQEHRRSR